MKSCIRRFCLAVTPCLTLSAAAWAGEIRVPQDQPDIQAAIDIATEGQAIVVADGTWSGRGNSNITFRGKRITVRSENGAVACTIDAQRSGSVFLFNTREQRDSVLEGFTLRGASQSAIHCTGAGPTVRSCVIDDNWNGLYGGGLMAEGGASPLVVDCVLSHNLAGVGAGAYVTGSTAEFERCEFFSNRTDLFGGGGLASADGADVSVVSCRFHDNRAIGFSGNGSGILITRASGLIVNSLFYRNTATYIGGGISSVLSTTRIVNSTFSENSAATYGSGIYTDSDTTIENSILWNDLVDEIYVADGSPVVRYSVVAGGWSGEGNRSDDPHFVDPAGDDYRLGAGSPAIDAGDSDAVPLTIDTDLDGLPRFLDDPSTPDTGRGPSPIVDIGAYEFQVGGGFRLTLVGICPGRVVLQWANAVPHRQMGVLYARSTGAVHIPGGACAGTQLGLGSSHLRLVTILPTGNGNGQVASTIGTGACGGYIQLAVADGQPCATSNVAQLP